MAASSKWTACGVLNSTPSRKKEEHSPCGLHRAAPGISAAILAPALLLAAPSFAVTAAPTAVTAPAARCGMGH
ncbi:hypothetical protein [Streptomyces hilarionis]|uniref:hypothetical protein n=1 Tax=Streptomyces hilarionis TaxID=2839954 RepID=UPI00211A7880|nr:hypothetical protein [Streptomyces hilarionis]MCQ9129216.1 hypothetical protein [Streptomyces hilarionis]